ncbi:MAG: TetR/AcrR family transcriptional regulator [Bacteroidota bacterium]
MKEKILKKTLDLFLTYGVKSVTMDDIAEELGISKKTIYQNFKNKSQLVNDATFYMFDKINDGIHQICALGLNSIEEIYSIRNLILEQLKNEKTSPQYQLQKYYPKIFDTLKQKQFETIDICITENLKKGIESGLYRKEIDIKLITLLYFNGMIGIKNMDLFPQNEFEVSYLMDSYLEYHTRAIATPKGLKILEKVLKK